MRFILTAATICLCSLQSLALPGCTSQTQAAAAQPDDLIELRVLIVEGRPNHTSLADTTQQKVGILSPAVFAQVRDAIATDNLSLLSAPHLITRAGQPASISCASEPGAGFVLSVNSEIEATGLLKIAFDYAETGTGFNARDLRALLHPGETAAVLVPNKDRNAFRTLLITASITSGTAPDRDSSVAAR